MVNNMTWRRLPLWVVMALLGATFAVAAIAAFGGMVQAQPASPLSISKTIKPKLVAVGQTQVYTIKITNTTDARLRGVTMRDPLPRNVKFIRASTSLQRPGSCGASGGTVTCRLGRLSAGQRVTIKIYVKTTKAGSYRNVAYASHTTAGFGAVPEISDAATHRAVRDDGGNGGNGGNGGKQGCGVRATAGSNDGARACVGGVKAIADR